LFEPLNGDGTPQISAMPQSLLDDWAVEELRNRVMDSANFSNYHEAFVTRKKIFNAPLKESATVEDVAPCGCPSRLLPAGKYGWDYDEYALALMTTLKTSRLSDELRVE
jgi:hypothetical protein